jgi:hypothetical protein
MAYKTTTPRTRKKNGRLRWIRSLDERFSGLSSFAFKTPRVIEVWTRTLIGYNVRKNRATAITSPIITTRTALPCILEFCINIGKRSGETISGNRIDVKRPITILMIHSTLCFHVICHARINTSPISRFIVTPIRSWKVAYS